MQTEQTKGRTWNGYVCPGCRNVFRVAAEFAGDEVMCPSCQETLRLPKNIGEAPPLSLPPHLTSPEPEPQHEEPASHTDEPRSAWRTLVASPAGRRKLALALGLPLLLIAVVLMLLPSNQTPVALTTSPPPPASEVKPLADPVEPIAVEVEQPVVKVEQPVTSLPETPMPPIADLAPEVLESEPLPETPAPALPVEVDPDPVTEVSKAPAAVPPATEPSIDPEKGLVEAIPAHAPPVSPPPAEAPAPPAVENPAPAVERHHVVVRGDTLTRISRKYATNPKAIMRANGMKNDIVRLGAKLIIPPSDP